MQSAVQVFPVICDITNEASVVAAVKAVVDHYGGLNVAVNNAGVSVSVPSDECTLEQWNWVMSVNCTGSFLVSREAIKVFKKQADGGALVFINSDNSLKPSKHFLAYNASKAAQLHLARTIANEFGSYHIRANSILPGAVFGGSAMWTPELRAARAKIHGFHPDQLEDEYKKEQCAGCDHRSGGDRRAGGVSSQRPLCQDDGECAGDRRRRAGWICALRVRHLRRCG